MSTPNQHPQPAQPQPSTTPHQTGAPGQPGPHGYPQSGQPPAGQHPGQADPGQPYPGQPYPQGYPAQGAQPGVPTPPRKSWFARHKILTGLGVVVLLAIIGGALGGGGEDEPATTAAVAGAPAADGPSDGAADTAEPAPEAPAEEPAPEEPAAPGIGTPVRDGKFEFTVTSVETGVATVGDEFLNQQAQGQYVLVHMAVTNIGTEAQMFDGSSQELTDTAGRTHSADTSAAIYLGDANSFLTDINPGNSVDGTVVFDIPADAVPATIDLHDSMFSGGVEVALG
ncbi:DUF4352 domain-containing protein [Cellulosimicrobium sp. CUA-896]|uniref:DUF4352 domain-containing protein n=1 Tax=Cellulosimicrobium sp. CUA-896 TaxID=1517881 RepID=UPI0009660F83|nr:DUF4352 domain-containing protein [Cellulosimicrobium sp. CUA-896]OLT54629.1 hypothetical protein BJF88_07920 [Cellulosimicrobium sp. CUA-896]